MKTEHTPGPWKIEKGGGHAYNRIVGSDSIQTNGWAERRNGIGNASYSDMVCENLGNLDLEGPKANAKLIAAAPELLEALKLVYDRLEWCGYGDTYENECASAGKIGEKIEAALNKATS